MQRYTYDCACVFIDLKKAFDALDRNILLRKLFAIGIKGTSYDWFRSYLNNRQQYTQIEDFTSKLQNILFGVPQGSKAGPTLFNVFINDLMALKLFGKLFMYADDIVLLYAEKLSENLELQINNDLDDIAIWMHRNRLTVNTDKTKFMIFGGNDVNICVKYCDNDIEMVNEFKYLGVTIDQHMKFDNHILTLSKKLAKTAGLFRKVSRYVPIEVKRSVFYALFASHLHYGIIAWGATHKTKIDKIQRIQNKAIRNLFNEDFYSHAAEIHRTNNLLPINLTIKMYQAIHIHSIFNNTIHSNTKIEPGQRLHFTRNNPSIRTYNIYSTTYGYNSALFSATRTYNAIPENIKQKSGKHFTSYMKNHTYNILSELTDI